MKDEGRSGGGEGRADEDRRRGEEADEDEEREEATMGQGARRDGRGWEAAVETREGEAARDNEERRRGARRHLDRSGEGGCRYARRRDAEKRG
jgi:hypothetical protein